MTVSLTDVMPRYPVVLASASPRRRELLRQLVPEFEVVPADVDEDSFTVGDPWETARKLAVEKARAVSKNRPEALVIGSDTVVAIAVGRDTFEQLAKPRDESDAVRMLQLLSGRKHVVVTGVALVRGAVEWVLADTTTVWFRPLQEHEIREYVATGEPLDKAGAYAIQGGASQFIEKVEGSTTNVIGLPLEQLGQSMREFGLL
jgi:septum formation protein